MQGARGLDSLCWGLSTEPLDPKPYKNEAFCPIS